MKITRQQVKQLKILELHAKSCIANATGQAAAAEKLLRNSTGDATHAINAFVIADAAYQEAARRAFAATAAAQVCGPIYACEMAHAINCWQRDRDDIERRTFPHDHSICQLVDNAIEKLKIAEKGYSAMCIADDETAFHLDDLSLDAYEVFQSTVQLLISTVVVIEEKAALLHLLIANIRRLIPYSAGADDYLAVSFYNRVIKSTRLTLTRSGMQ